MDIQVVIPARYKSARLPGKPLIDLEGKAMIHRTYDQCLKVFPPSMVTVATEDKRVYDYCKLNQINVLMTSDQCLTGTDRVSEVSTRIDADYYVNVQGDEPVFNPKDLIKFVNALELHNGKILNGYCRLDSVEQYLSLSVPKVVFREDGRLLYMSRSPIPGNKEAALVQAWRQVCVYAFTKKALAEFSALKRKTRFEQIEDIEILRFLELGYEVQMIELSNDSISVDTPADVEKVKHLLKSGK